MLGKPAVKGVNQSEVPVHVLVLDERTAHDDLWNQNERHDVRRGFRIGHETGDDETKRDPAHRGHKHDAEIDPEHAADLENVIAVQDKENALDDGEEAKRKELRENVVVQSDEE